VAGDRDRDTAGRARNARPRDTLGRPLPYGATGEERAPEGVVRTPEVALAEAQRLLDSGRPFHAHEVLEDAWKTAPDEERQLWRGLAQLAVGLTHAARGNIGGARALLARGAENIQPYEVSPPHGIDVAGLVRWARSPGRAPAGPTPPRLRSGATMDGAMSAEPAPAAGPDDTALGQPAPPRGPVTSASYSLTVRLTADGDPASIGRIATAVGSAGGAVTAIDVVDSRSDGLTVDVTCSAADAAHSEEMIDALRAVPGVTVGKVSDRTFLLHLGGKLEVASKVPLKTRDDLSMAYTPGVARVCLALAEHPEDVRRLTIKGNTVAVVTDGSAVLGLGDIGPGAAMPVMEGKAVLFKRFAGIDAWPICLDTKDVDEIVRAVELIAPGFGGINLEDIAAPRCFEIERRLREKLDIPVFHDDQHGTAIVLLAALRNALRVVGKRLGDVRIALAGGGAAGTAIVHLLLEAGVGQVLVWDREGILSPDDERLSPAKRALAEATNPGRVRGELADALDGADVFIGVSAGNILPVEDLARMAPGAVVFPLANPTPEVDPLRARQYAAVVASGRSDLPNQINNVLAFPGVFRGLLDARATEISDGMLVAASEALAAVVKDDQLNANYIIPSVFDPEVTKTVARAVAEQARHEPGATARVRGEHGR
jgi:malate dehydrogenase (oxaloacetate-decarboxylating)